MLNFETVQEVSKKMQDESFIYAETFLQHILDSIKFDKDNPTFIEYEFYNESFPAGADPLDCFKDISFGVECTARGHVKFIFDKIPDEQTISDERLILLDVLYKNGFFEPEIIEHSSNTKLVLVHTF